MWKKFVEGLLVWIQVYFFVSDVSNADPPAAVDGRSLADIVFGDGEIGDFFDVDGRQRFHSGLEILVVGGEEDNAAFSHHGDYRLKEMGVVRDDIKL